MTGHNLLISQVSGASLLGLSKRLSDQNDINVVPAKLTRVTTHFLEVR